MQDGEQAEASQGDGSQSASGCDLKMDLGWELEVGDEDGGEQLSAYKASMAL